jgi:hypothetical protein
MKFALCTYSIAAMFPVVHPLGHLRLGQVGDAAWRCLPAAVADSKRLKIVVARSCLLLRLFRARAGFSGRSAGGGSE